MTMGDAPPRVTLYGHWICPYSVRVSFALAQRRIPHDVVDVPPSAVRPAGYVVPPAFVAHSPKAEIPMVRVGEAFRADSLPVLEWLEACVPDRPLLPADRVGRDLVRSRMAWIDATVFPAMIGVYYGTRDDRIARASDALTDALAALGDRLDGDGWLAGDAPSLAEATVVPVYVRLDALRRLGFTGALDPRVERHVARCGDLEGWAHVAWDGGQVDELVGRFERHRARARYRRDG
jgi:glutathione S-transferase